ncbi:MAG TPA: phospho-N-acetylmuramoyl-pentapeptide-transferase [Planctomycetota bacterium]|nr:phospho-N-acetylmuramoyl-pentapeptide-transferase [Planctomycetota bacterium]
MLYELHRLSASFAALHIFESVVFRAAFAGITAFFLCLMFGPSMIQWLRIKKLGEDTSKTDSPDLKELHKQKKGTPTMGGVLIIGALSVSSLLWMRWDLYFSWLVLLSGWQLCVIGILDDWIKLTRSGESGLSARAKLGLQMLTGLCIGLGLYLYGDPAWSTRITFPLIDPATFSLDLGPLYVLFAGLVVAFTSNAVNLTDGLDGLAIGNVTITALAFGLIAFLCGNEHASQWLRVPTIVGAQELSIIAAAMAGAGAGFLWFNAHPAEVFMGDTGSLALGGMIGSMALVVKQEALLVLVGGVFFIEIGSVMLQVASFKLRGKRIFLCAPFHHHLQMKGWSENRIVTRMWILGLLLAAFSLLSLQMH